MFDISFSIFYHSVLPSIGAINYAFFICYSSLYISKHAYPCFQNISYNSGLSLDSNR